MTSLDSLLQEKLNKRKSEGLYRELKLNGSLMDFCSNDYLGLARSSELAEMIEDKLRNFPVSNGSTGSRLLAGNSAFAEELERKLARIFDNESAVLFNSGFLANLSVLSALPQKNDTIIYDELAHACIKDGARLSHANRFSFRHNNLDDLRKKIKRSTGKVFIAIESVYSMDGDQAPLAQIVEISKEFDASIILDEAHSTGSFGRNGSGLAIQQDVHKGIDVRVYTFGKAMGVHGACVACSDTVRNYLINFARPFIYTTALPLHSLVAIECAFDYLSQHEQIQKDLVSRIDTFVKETERISAKVKSETSIQSILIPGNANAKSLALELQKNGFDVRPILSPTVPEGKERLRICLHAFNEEKDIIELAKVLKFTLNRMPLSKTVS